MNDVATESSEPFSAFNSPIECGLRSAVLLAAAYPRNLDLQRLVQYDYLLVHSGDVAGAPASIHPATPHRSGELLVRRPLIEAGIKLMMSKSIIECEMSPAGILYFAGEWCLAFLGSLSAEYTRAIKTRAHWVISNFAGLSDTQLTEFMRENWAHWGAEFEFDALLRESEL